LVAMVGSLMAMASSGGRPNPSPWVVVTKASAALREERVDRCYVLIIFERSDCDRCVAVARSAAMFLRTSRRSPVGHDKLVRVKRR
jgi:hypothetical protein